MRNNNFYAGVSYLTLKAVKLPDSRDRIHLAAKASELSLPLDPIPVNR